MVSKHLLQHIVAIDMRTFLLKWGKKCQELWNIGLHEKQIQSTHYVQDDPL